MSSDPASAAPRKGPQLWPLWSPLLARAERWSEARLRWTLFAPFALAMPLAYALVAQWAAASGRVAWDPTGPWDRALPALPVAVWIYATHLAYYPATVVCTNAGPGGTRDLLILMQAMTLVGLISFACFILLPAHVDLRDQLTEPLSRSGPAVRGIFAVLHRVDPPYNAWPSLHISQTLLAALYIQHHKRRARVRLVPWLLWGLLAVSVLLTKQHLAFDVVTGAALGWVAWRAYVRPRVGLCAPPSSPLPGAP